MINLHKIALAQINPTVGDIAGNVKKIIDAWKKASDDGAELVVFPELCLVGYPPEDLILTLEFRKIAMAEVRNIATKTKGGAGLIIGCVWEIALPLSSCTSSGVDSCTKAYTSSSLPSTEKKLKHYEICNAALLLDDGEIKHIQPKTNLPNYGVFDEKRVFSQGQGAKVTQFRGRSIGILVCEDVWNSELAVSLKTQGAEVIFVINASPFEVGKLQKRHQVVAEAAKASKLPIYYVNMVGGQDDLLFDGGSFITNSVGEITASFPQFQECISLTNDQQLTTNNCSPELEIWGAMKLALADYVHKNGFSSVVLGLSGGIDSAVSVAVAVDALGAENVHGVLLPSPYSSVDSVEDALESANLLGIKTRTIAITTGMKMFEDLLSPEFGNNNWLEDVSVGGNLQARLRGITLMALSNKYGWLLLSTGNKSEISVGYSTLYGDSCGSYNVLKDVYKTTVYKLAKWRNEKSPAIPHRSISKAPSAELKPDQKDSDQLPDYDILDAILEYHIEGRLCASEIIAKGFSPEIVAKILRLVRMSEYKRRQSCAGVKISPMLFGKDRRFPMTNKF